MLNHLGIINFQIFITPGKNIREFFHEIDISLLDLWADVLDNLMILGSS